MCNYLCWRAAEAVGKTGGPRSIAFVHVPNIARGSRRSGKRRRLNLDDLTRAGRRIGHVAVDDAPGDAGLNAVAIATTSDNLLAQALPSVAVILVGDLFYEKQVAELCLSWLRQASTSQIYIGDPGRSYLPKQELRKIAEYSVPVSRDLEDAAKLGLGHIQEADLIRLAHDHLAVFRLLREALDRVVGDLAAPGKPLLEMEDSTSLRLEADVPEAVVGRIMLGEKLPVRISALETELEGVRRARDTVLANISHEFRTPLAAQLASIELLREGLTTRAPEKNEVRL